MTSKLGLHESKYLKVAKLLALAPMSILLACCPPLIVPHFETRKYETIYSIPADPHPWLALKDDGIDLYLYQECYDVHRCHFQKLVAIKNGTRPEWKDLLDARGPSLRVQGEHVPMRRPLSAYVPGTKYRLIGSFDHFPKIVFSIPKKTDRSSILRRAGIPEPVHGC